MNSCYECKKKSYNPYFCSQKCYKAFIDKHGEHICEECKSYFIPYPTAKFLQYGQKFCTEQCKIAFKRKQSFLKEPKQKKQDINRNYKIAWAGTDPWPIPYYAWKRSKTCRG